MRVSTKNHKPIPNITDSLVDKFWDNVDISQNNDNCWEWKANRFIGGYGRFNINRSGFKAHRISYFLTSSKDPLNLIVCHSCDNPSCCNPNHLFVGTHQDNSDDRGLKGRQAKGERSGAYTKPNRVARGERNGSSKLTDENVIEIARLYSSGKYSIKQLALKFGVSKLPVTKIIKRTLWKHLDLSEFTMKVKTNSGSDHYDAKFTDKQIIEMRKSHKGIRGEMTKLANKYGVACSVIYNILNGKTWKHLLPENIKTESHAY